MGTSVPRTQPPWQQPFRTPVSAPPPILSSTRIPATGLHRLPQSPECPQPSLLGTPASTISQRPSVTLSSSILVQRSVALRQPCMLFFALDLCPSLILIILVPPEAPPDHMEKDLSQKTLPTSTLAPPGNLAARKALNTRMSSIDSTSQVSDPVSTSAESYRPCFIS